MAPGWSGLRPYRAPSGRRMLLTTSSDEQRTSFDHLSPGSGTAGPRIGFFEDRFPLTRCPGLFDLLSKGSDAWRDGRGIATDDPAQHVSRRLRRFPNVHRARSLEFHRVGDE